MELDAKLKIKDLVKAPNIAELLNDEDLNIIGQAAHDGWETDKESRSDWEDKTSEALKLAMQVCEKKTFPWEGASNVKFPIITIAALQYQSRAYPALIPGNQIVKTRTYGNDPTGEKTKRANRISNYMSFQVLEEDELWEQNMDEVLISQAIVGSAFKKTYFCPKRGHNVSQHILAKNLYIPYYAKSLESASRITEMLYYSRNELLSAYRSGLYLELAEEIAEDEAGNSEQLVSTMTDTTDEAQGVHPGMDDPTQPRELLEQHCWLDLDGDGFQEPYVVTVDRQTQFVLRIVARYTSTDVAKNGRGEITDIKATNFYTKYTFIPSPDGGIYDLGFGPLLGPVNESINTILNQLVDAGTMQVTAGGFLGRGAKLKSGDNSFRPFEWKRMDATGDDIRKSIFPLPTNEPSQVLFQLLGLLIDYGERIGMATDPLVGVNPGQNTPAETSRSMVQEGQRIFNAVFKRTYRAMKEEFRKMYDLNAVYLNDETSFIALGDSAEDFVFRADFMEGNKEIVPYADPNLVSKEEKIRQAMLLKQSAAEAGGMYNTYLVEKRLLEAMSVEDIESVLPDPKGPNAIPSQPDTKVVIETMKLEQKNMEFKMNLQLKMFDLTQEIEYLRAEILEKETRAMLNMAQAEGVEAGHQIAAIQSGVSLLKQKQDGLIAALQALRDVSGMGATRKGIVDDIKDGVEGVDDAPDDQGVVEETGNI